MTTVTKINKEPVIHIDLQLKHWELAALGASVGLFALMSWCLLTDYSLRRVFWPGSGEGSLAKPIGKVTFSLNKTLRQGSDQSEFVALAREDAVYPRDTLMAGPNSALKITLSDNTIVEVGENSMIRLNFDSSLKLSGINRETVVEVVTGTVAAQGSATSTLKIKSQDKTYTATQERSLELSRNGAVVAAHEGSQGKMPDLIAQAKQAGALREKLAAEAIQEKTKALAQAKQTFSKMGGVLTPNAVQAPSLSDMAKSLNPKFPLGGGGTNAHSEDALRPRVDIAKSTAIADEMMKAPSSKPSKTRVEMARAFKIEPLDNFSIKTTASQTKLKFPVNIRFKADPENYTYTLRFSQVGRPDEVVQVKADGDEARLKFALKRPGDYVWKIEDAGGAVLSVRNFHVNSKFQSIRLADPVLIGRERGSKMWGAQDKWGFLFKWTPVKDVAKYKVKITRNVKTEGTAEAPALSERMVTENEFVLPFKKEWQAEKMFFSVEAEHPQGFHLASNNVPFIFTFIPPKPRSPLSGKVLDRSRLSEGVIDIEWEADTSMERFTLEIATDPAFKHKLETEQLTDKNYRYYPPDAGHYYWRVRGDKETLSSPFSETWDFTVK